MRFETIVVGVDGSANAAGALEVAANLAGLDSTVHVITAYQPMADKEIADVLASLPDEFHDSYDPVAGPRETLARADLYLENRGIDHKSHLVKGHPASMILDLADSCGADLIVVGSRGLGLATRFVRGSTSARIANHAHCSFLIVQET